VGLLSEAGRPSHELANEARMGILPFIFSPCSAINSGSDGAVLKSIFNTGYLLF
jgi:hypothetical protein